MVLLCSCPDAARLTNESGANRIIIIAITIGSVAVTSFSGPVPHQVHLLMMMFRPCVHELGCRCPEAI